MLVHRARSQKRRRFFLVVVSFAVGRLRYLLHEGFDTTRDDGGEARPKRESPVLYEHPLFTNDGFEAESRRRLMTGWMG